MLHKLFKGHIKYKPRTEHLDHRRAPHWSIEVRSALECPKHALLIGKHIAKRISSKSWSERKIWFFFIFDLFSFPLPVCVSPRFYSFMYEDFLGVQSFNQVGFERTYVGIWQGTDDCLRIADWVAMERIQPLKYVRSWLISFLITCFATLTAKFWSVRLSVDQLQLRVTFLYITIQFYY